MGAAAPMPPKGSPPYVGPRKKVGAVVRWTGPWERRTTYLGLLEQALHAAYHQKAIDRIDELEARLNAAEAEANRYIALHAVSETRREEAEARLNTATKDDLAERLDAFAADAAEDDNAPESAALLRAEADRIEALTARAKRYEKALRYIMEADPLDLGKAVRLARATLGDEPESPAPLTPRQRQALADDLASAPLMSEDELRDHERTLAAETQHIAATPKVCEGYCLKCEYGGHAPSEERSPNPTSPKPNDAASDQPCATCGYGEGSLNHSSTFGYREGRHKYEPVASKWDHSRVNANGQPLCRTCGEYGYHDWCSPDARSGVQEER